MNFHGPIGSKDSLGYRDPPTKGKRPSPVRRIYELGGDSKDQIPVLHSASTALPCWSLPSLKPYPGHGCHAELPTGSCTQWPFASCARSCPGHPVPSPPNTYWSFQRSPVHPGIISHSVLSASLAFSLHPCRIGQQAGQCG